MQRTPIGPGVLAGRFLLVSYLGWLPAAGLHTLRLRDRAAERPGTVVTLGIMTE